jgi:ABC-type uncharacterized transport system fused permease/ATPase subunit
MAEEKNIFQNLIDHIKEYLNVKIEIFQLSSAEKLATILAGLISNLIFIIIILFILLFSSITLALYLSDININIRGFFIITLIYIFLGIVFLIIKKKLIKEPLINHFIKQFFKNSGDEK